jgi:hypothetical protein
MLIYPYKYKKYPNRQMRNRNIKEKGQKGGRRKVRNPQAEPTKLISTLHVFPRPAKAHYFRPLKHMSLTPDILWHMLHCYY